VGIYRRFKYAEIKGCNKDNITIEYLKPIGCIGEGIKDYRNSGNGVIFIGDTRYEGALVEIVKEEDLKIDNSKLLEMKLVSEFKVDPVDFDYYYVTEECLEELKRIIYKRKEARIEADREAQISIHRRIR